MKKTVCILLALFVLCGCGGTKVEKKNFGETVSSDIIEFTFDSADLSYYASSVAKPVKSSSGTYVAGVGHVLVCMKFTIKNIDRTSISVADSFGWPLRFTANYKGKDYSINGFDLNQKDGDPFGLRLDRGCQISNGKAVKAHSKNSIQDAGETITYRVVGIANFDPDSLNDSFSITISLPNSESKETKYTYTK